MADKASGASVGSSYRKKSINFRGVIPIEEYAEKDYLAVKKIVEDNKRLNQKKRTNLRTQKTPVKTGELRISRFRLAVAIVKSIFSRGTDREIIQTMANSWFIQLGVLLKEKDDGIYIDKDTANLLRDFSKSCRDGELAQGISYIFAQDWLGAVAVEDFNVYCYEHKNFTPKCSGRAPDYVLIHNDGSISLLESKGSLEANPIKDIISGMDQCENGNDYMITQGILPNDYYVSAIIIEDVKTAKNKTAITAVDPSSGNEKRLIKKPENISWSILREYSKFFYIAGDPKLDEMLSAEDSDLRKPMGLYRKYFKDLCDRFDIEKEAYEREKEYDLYRRSAMVDPRNYKKRKPRIDLELGLIVISSREYVVHLDTRFSKSYKVKLGITYNAAKYLSENLKQEYRIETVYRMIGFHEGDLEIFPDGTYMMVMYEE